MGLPTIAVKFKALAQSANTRSERGVLAIVVKETASSVHTYGTLAEVPTDLYTATNYADISRAFLASPNKVIVVADSTAAKATAVLDELSYNWVTTNETTYSSALVTYVKSINTASRVRQVKCVVAGVSSANDKHVVNLANTSVVSGSNTINAVNYVPRIAGILAACPLTQSVTGYVVNDLSGVNGVTDVGTSIDNGNLVLYRDDDVIRIARGVNTLTTLSADDTADMKKITVIEAMDIITEDIIKTFKDNYMGKVKNTGANQGILVADVISYFKELINEGVLDSTGVNTCEVNVNAMRNAWISAGVDVSEMSDAEIKNKTYGSYVYLSATTRIPDAMEDLTVEIMLG